MDQQSQNMTPELNLPEPQMNQLPKPGEVLIERSANEMAGATSVDQGTGSGMPLPINPSVVMAPTSGAAAAPIVPSPALQVPMVADDTDLIEKEWVQRAKNIVEATRMDPRQQNKEMNRMKADYMKLRYNKDLKLSQD